MRVHKVIGAAAACGAVLAAACYGGHAERRFVINMAGDATRGAAIIEQADCGSCHMIPGIRGARGVVGPPLLFMARRTYIAGRIPNRPENLVQWVMDPKQVDPMTAMPDLGLSRQEAQDVAAYLYTLN